MFIVVFVTDLLRKISPPSSPTEDNKLNLTPSNSKLDSATNDPLPFDVSSWLFDPGTFDESPPTIKLATIQDASLLPPF